MWLPAASSTVGVIAFRCAASIVPRPFDKSFCSRRQLVLGVPALVAAATLARAQSRPEKPALRLAVGGKTTLYHLPLTVAEQLGYFKAEGLDVELQDHAGGGLAEQALVHEQAEVAAGGFEHVMGLRQRGNNCRAFVFLGRAPQLVFGVNPRGLPEFRDMSQLKGRRIGVSAPDSSTHWFANYVLARGGLAPHDVEFVNVGTSTAAVMAVREGRIEALSSIDPVVTMLEYRGDLRVLRDTRSLRGTKDVFGGPMVGGCVYAQQDFLTRYPNTTQALTNAVVRALKWLQTAGPSDIVRAVPEAYMYGDRAIYLAALDKAREAVSPDGMASEDGILTALRVGVQHGAAVPSSRPVVADTTYTNEFARRAKQRYMA